MFTGLDGISCTAGRSDCWDCFKYGRRPWIEKHQPIIDLNVLTGALDCKEHLHALPLAVGL